MATKCGGHSAVKADPEGIAKITLWRPLFEKKAGAPFADFEVLGYTTQVVAGVNYKVKVRIAETEYAHAKVFVPLGENPSPQVTEFFKAAKEDSL